MLPKFYAILRACHTVAHCVVTIYCHGWPVEVPTHGIIHPTSAWVGVGLGMVFHVQ